jgi:hypothetical protein
MGAFMTKLKAARERLGHLYEIAARLECRHGLESATLAGASAMVYLALSAVSGLLTTILSDSHFFGSFQDPVETSLFLIVYALAIGVPSLLSVLIWRSRSMGAAWAGLCCSATALGINLFPIDSWTLTSILAATASLQGLRGAYATGQLACEAELVLAPQHA